MSKTSSPSTRKRYGLQRVCKIWGIPRSTFYSQHRRHQTQKSVFKRGPRPPLSDTEVLACVREMIDSSPFTGEGHRKIHARICRELQSVPLGRDRVRRIMRDNNLLSPHRVFQGKARKHDGRITTDEPGIMWATDAAKILTVEDGWVWFFGVIEHWNSECLGWHLVKRGDRFAAIEALSQAVKNTHGAVEAVVCRGLKLRMDHGSQFKSQGFLHQVKYWGLVPSFGFVREPETNGVIERFHRTFKEQIIHGGVYQGIEELRQTISRFIETYNESWLLEKLGYLSPREESGRRGMQHKRIQELVERQPFQSKKPRHSCSVKAERSEPKGSLYSTAVSWLCRDEGVLDDKFEETEILSKFVYN